MYFCLVLWGRSQSHNKNYSLFWGSIVIRNNVTKNIFRNRQILLNKFVIVLFLKNKGIFRNDNNNSAEKADSFEDEKKHKEIGRLEKGHRYIKI